MTALAAPTMAYDMSYTRTGLTAVIASAQQNHRRAASLPSEGDNLQRPRDSNLPGRPEMPLRVPTGEAQPRTASSYAEINGEAFVHAAFMLLWLTFHCISN